MSCVCVKIPVKKETDQLLVNFINLVPRKHVHNTDTLKMIILQTNFNYEISFHSVAILSTSSHAPLAFVSVLAFQNYHYVLFILHRVELQQ